MRIGVLLGGCGRYDGTDVYEAVLTVLALEGAGEKAVLLAPAIPQDRAVDHLSGDEIEGETRDVLKESARLALGPIRSLAECRPFELEAIIIPGGYGPVINFSSGYARLGEARRIIPVVADFIRHFLETGKPIGLVSLGEVPVRTLLGQDMGPPPAAAPVTVDRERRIVHTPGFASYTRLREVQAGIEAMVREVLSLMQERRTLAARGTAVGGPEAGR